MEYTRRATAIEAVKVGSIGKDDGVPQWFNDAVDAKIIEMRQDAFGGGQSAYVNDITNPPCGKFAKAGDYVVRESNGFIHVTDGSAFEAEYEEAATIMPAETTNPVTDAATTTPAATTNPETKT